MALGAALVVITSTETIIAGNFRNSTQAFYAAEAAAELAVAELRTRTHWIGVVEGAERSQFIDGAPGGVRGLPTDAPVDLTAIVNIANCGAPHSSSMRRVGSSSPTGPFGLWRLRAPPTRRSTSWRSSLGARQNRARPSSRFGVRPSVRAGPTRPSKSPSPERTAAKPSSCGPSSVDRRLAEHGPSKTVTREGDKTAPIQPVLLEGPRVVRCC